MTGYVSVRSQLEKSYADPEVPVRHLVALLWRYLTNEEKLVDQLLSPTVLACMEIYTRRQDERRSSRAASLTEARWIAVRRGEASVGLEVASRAAARMAPRNLSPDERAHRYVAELFADCSRLGAGWDVLYLVGGGRLQTVEDALQLEDGIRRATLEAVLDAKLDPLPYVGMELVEWNRCVTGVAWMLSDAVSGVVEEATNG